MKRLIFKINLYIAILYWYYIGTILVLSPGIKKPYRHISGVLSAKLILRLCSSFQSAGMSVGAACLEGTTPEGSVTGCILDEGEDAAGFETPPRSPAWKAVPSLLLR